MQAMERTQRRSELLTDRQRQVWRLVAKGHTNGEIAEALGISLDGAKWHVSELLVRLDVDTREDLVQAWDAQHRPATRLRNAFRALAAFSWPKAAGAGIAIGSVAVAGVVIAAARSGSGTAAQETAGETATATPPSGGISTVLSEQDALSRAEQVADQLVVDHLMPYLPGGPLSSRDMKSVASEYLPAGTSYTTQDGLYVWPAASGTPAWVFSWLGEDEGFVEGPLGGLADVRVEVVLADRIDGATLAAQAQVQVSNAGVWQYGHVLNLESRLPGRDEFAPAGEAFEITPAGGGPAGERLVLYESRNGNYCHRAIRPAGGAGGGCGPFTGGAGDEAISVMAWGGSGTGIGGDVWPPFILIRTSPQTAWLAVQSADGTEDRFPAMEIPPALGLPYRIAYFTSPKLEEEHWFVAYDAAGNEIYRQGPWEPGNPPSYFLPRAN